MRSGVLERGGLSLRVLLHGGEPRRWPSWRQLVRGFRNLCRVLGPAALFMPPSEGQEPRALTDTVQVVGGRKCAETAKVHPDLRIVYNLAYGVLAGEAGRFFLVGDYTTTIQKTNRSRLVFFARSHQCWRGFRVWPRECHPSKPCIFAPADASLFFVFPGGLASVLEATTPLLARVLRRSVVVGNSWGESDRESRRRKKSAWKPRPTVVMGACLLRLRSDRHRAARFNAGSKAARSRFTMAAKGSGASSFFLTNACHSVCRDVAHSTASR